MSRCSLFICINSRILLQFCHSLYPSCQWEDKAVRRLIGDGRLAARLEGHDTRASMNDLECPICFLQYSQINVTQCCKAYMCTECFLQVRPQKEKLCSCPFCNNPKLFVSVARKLDPEQLQERQADEQRAIAMQIQKQNIHDADQFGATLEKRIRSQSVGNDVDPEILIRQLSMTEDDRRAIETEMRAQHTHPLALQMQAEAEQRRLQNEQEYYRTNSGRIREAALLRVARMGSHGGDRIRGERSASGPRNWNDIVSSFERGGGEQVNSLDDLVVLEAAILLSMEEEARRARNGETVPENSTFNATQHARDGFPLIQHYLSSSQRRLGGRGFYELTEDEQVAMAIALSMQEASESETSADTTRNTDTSDDVVITEGNETDEFSKHMTVETAPSSGDEDADQEHQFYTMEPATLTTMTPPSVALAAAQPPRSENGFFDDSDQQLPSVYFDDSDQQLNTIDFDESDKKLPAVDFDASDKKMPAVDFDESDGKVPAKLDFDESDGKIPAVCLNESNEKLSAGNGENGDDKLFP